MVNIGPEAGGACLGMATRRWSDRDNDRMVDLIYDAAFDEALWPSVLERLGDRVGAHPGNMTQLNFVDGSGVGLAARAPDDIMTRYFADWAGSNPIAIAENTAAYPVGWTPRITRDGESVDRRLLERSAFWNEFLVPIGAYHLTILRLSLRENDVTTITLGRPNHHGAFADDEVDALRPLHRHLIRAERMGRTLGLRQAEFDRFDALLAGAADALFFLDDTFRVRSCTPPAEAMLRGGGLRVTGGRLCVVDGRVDTLLQAALVTALGGGAPSPVAVASRPGEMLTLSVARLGERASVGLNATRALLVSARRANDGLGALRALHGLTLAEAQLALALASGDSLRTVADRRGVSINTVRNQLSAVFDKTGCRRQQDLIRLLAATP